MMAVRGRSGFVALAVVGLAATALLTACSGNESTASDGTTAGSSLLPPGEGTTEYPLTIDTRSGEFVLEERPERVAVVSYTGNVDAVYALGVTPVYVDSSEIYPWHDEEWVAGIENVDEDAFPTNFEAIAAANPDVIIAVNSNVTVEELEQLGDIAPVVENKEPPSDKFDWRQIQRKIGEALDLSAAADEAIAEADSAIDAAAAAHPEFAGKTATLAQNYDDGTLVYYSPTGGVAENLLVELGFDPNPLAANFVEAADVSLEQVGLLDADVLLMFQMDQAAKDSIESQEVFRRVPVVAEGRYVPSLFEGEDIPVEGYASWVVHNGASAVSLPPTVDYLAAQLSEGLLPN